MKPNIVDEMSAQEVLDRFLTDLSALKLTEKDPGYKILSAAAYRELLVRQRINEAARNVLLEYSKDKDQLTSIRRQPDETLDQWIERIITARKGRSLSGPSDGYRALAMAIAPKEIRDVAVYRRRAGVVRVVVLASNQSGKPSEELLAQIRKELAKPDVRLVTDTVEVSGPVLKPVSIAAKVYLLPDAPMSDFERLEDLFRAEFEKNRAFGRDITVSWCAAILHARGVYSVELGGYGGTVVKPYEAGFLKELTLTFGGRDV